jgi:hypothetical protein
MDSSPIRRIGIPALAIAALGASFAAGAAWDDDSKPRGRIVAAPQRLPVVPQGPGSLVRVGGCADLLDWYVDNTVDQVTPWGWNGGWGYYNGVRRDGILRSDTLAGELAAAPSATGDARAAEQSSSATGTNVQESGVDEPDLVKTNGELMVRIEGDDLTTYDVSGAKVRKLSTIDLPGTTDDSAELLLIGDQVVVLAQEAQRWEQQTIRTTVRRVDLANPEEPDVLDEQSYDASLVSARQYGDTVRLVLGTGLPALDFVQPNEKRTEREALKENRRIVRESDIEDWLPSVREDGGDAELAVGCDSMSRPEDFAGGGSVVVVGYDAESPTERSSLGVATSSSIVYSSADRIYLATSPMWWGCCVIMEGDIGWGRRVAPDGNTDDGVTSLHAFELAGTEAAYVGSGEVEGIVRDRWSMDAVDGTLRVAVGASSQTGNFNSIVTLREKDGALEEIGRLDRLGVNEQIKSVRWFDDLAFVVTFRQTDPLYAIDLSNPARPRKLAALKIPGFSEYLHPIGDDLMIGIGTDASLSGMTRGGQAAVFDISDLTNLRRVAKHGYGMNRQTMAGSDPRQFTWLPDRRTALTVVSEWGRDGGAAGLVSVLEVGADGALTTRMLRGTYGYDDVAHLRTVPLPDGRVVLATENGARFLTW